MKECVENGQIDHFLLIILKYVSVLQIWIEEKYKIQNLGNKELYAYF